MRGLPAEASVNDITERLILNTRRKKRLDSITEIAKLVDAAERRLGGLPAVAATAGISVEMLRRFQYARQLNPEVQALVAERKIDNLNVIIALKGHAPADQLQLAHAYLDGQVSAEELRALAPTKRARSRMPVNALLARLQRTRDKHVYVARFRFPRGSAGLRVLERALRSLLGAGNLLALTVNENVATLETTRTGRDILRKGAKQQGRTLRQFIAHLVGALTHV